jgi:hypothetical protein
VKLLRSLILFCAAILATKIAITLSGLLVSLSQLIAELTQDESGRIMAYEVIIIYCVLSLGVVITNGVMIYQEAKHKTMLKWFYVIAPVATILYGSHLAYAYTFNIENAVLNDFVKGFDWLPMLGILVMGIKRDASLL